LDVSQGLSLGHVRSDRLVGPVLGQNGSRPRGIGLPERPTVVPPAQTGLELGAEAGAFGTDLRHLRGSPAPALDPRVELLVVLEAPRAVGLDNDVELEVLRVETDRRSAEGLLDVDVPGGELTAGPDPEDPDGVHLAGALKLEHAVP
jgi:hypothetical protein